MTQSPSNAIEDTIRQELEKAANLISGARRLMGEGRHVDLSAIEERVRVITESVESAPEAIAQNYKDHLEALFSALDVLEHDIETHHEALEQSLKNLKHREAQDAYGDKEK